MSAIDLYADAEKWKYVAASHNYTTPLAGNNSVYFGSVDVVWFGDPVNYFRPVGDWELARDATQAEQLLSVKFIDATESGNYYSKSTQTGQNQGLPPWLKTTAAPVMENKGVIPLACDELNDVVAWRKAFHPRESSGLD